MLRSEHVTARLQRGRLVPHRLPLDNPRALDVAERLCALYEAHRDRPRATLERRLTEAEEELGPPLDARRGFRIVRALAKLLEERAEWAAPTAADPYTVRTRIFELAAARPELPAAEPGLLDTTTREDVLAQVARETGLEDPAAVMYADRQGAQVLGAFDRPTPEELVGRYNVAQVQGVLYAARDLVVDLGAGADARLVFHYVKRMALIYGLQTTQNGYRLRLDGPLSLFGSTRKYGLRLAKFLPGLLLTTPWRLSATVEWRGRDTQLELDSETSGLVSHYAGPRRDEEEDDARAAFVRAWDRAKDTGGWNLEESADILPLPERKTALVPDFTFKKDGAKVHLEMLGFWSEKHLVDRVDLVREAGHRGHRLLLAASENLGAGRDVLAEASGGVVVPFKGRLKVDAVLAALRE